MCAALELNSHLLRPGRVVGVWRREGRCEVVWAGFARHEILNWWRTKGYEPVDVPAHRFAERSQSTRKLAWEIVPSGLVVRGLVEQSDGGTPLLKVVTRAATFEETARFDHPRMPLLEPPLFSAEAIDLAPDAQQELF